MWLSAATQEYLDSGVTSTGRVTHFEELVADRTDSVHCPWLRAEDKTSSDLERHFGFTLAGKSMDDVVSEPDAGYTHSQRRRRGR
jgi:hypothetical protein